MSDLKQIYVKEVFTCNTKNYMVNPLWTTYQLIEFIKENSLQDFNLENIEVVDTSHNNLQCCQEDAPAIIPDTNITLALKYGSEINVSFYIRPIRQIRPIPIRQRQINQENVCSICLTRPLRIMISPCNHLCLCNEEECSNRLISCPICRGLIESRITVYI